MNSTHRPLVAVRASFHGDHMDIDPLHLMQTDEEAEQRWEALDDAELDLEIEEYRDKVRQAKESLAALDISPVWPKDQSSIRPPQSIKSTCGAGGGGEPEPRWLQ